MKKIIASVLLGMSMISFASCSSPMKNSGSSRENSLNTPFETNVSIALDRLEANGNISRIGDGIWSVEFESPNTLSGIKLDFIDGDVKASYKGLEFSVPQSAVPVKAMMLNLIRAIDENAKADELSGEENGGKFTISGSLEGGSYDLTLDRNGLPLCFEMPNNKLKMDFTELKLSENVTLSEETAACTSTAEIMTTAVFAGQDTEEVFGEQTVDFAETPAQLAD